MTEQNPAPETRASSPDGNADNPVGPIARSLPGWLRKPSEELSAFFGAKVTLEAKQVTSPAAETLAALAGPAAVCATCEFRSPDLVSKVLLLASDDVVLALAASKSGQPKAAALDDASTAVFGSIAQSVSAGLKAAWSAARLGDLAFEPPVARRIQSLPEGFSAGKAVCAEISLALDGGPTVSCRLIFGDAFARFLVVAEEAGTGAPLTENIDRILKITVPVIVEIARRRITVKEVVAFKPGTVVEFNKKNDDLLDLTAGSAKVGKGEAIKVGESFGLRVTEVGTVEERIKSLGVQP